MAEPALEELLDSIVVLSDAGGQRARYLVEHVSGDTAVCSYLFKGRHRAPIAASLGERVELGAPSPRGWVVATGKVGAVTAQGIVTVTVEDLQVVQRRRAYRETVVVPFILREDLSSSGRRGRTDNLSIGGFAGRVHGPPIPTDAELLVVFEMPEGDQVVATCRKVAGDIQQRFAFRDLSRTVEDRLAKLVRAAELEKRRAAGRNR